MKQKEVKVGMMVWACEGKLIHRLCTVESIKGDKALIRSVRGGGIDWVDKNSLDTSAEIE